MRQAGGRITFALRRCVHQVPQYRTQHARDVGRQHDALDLSALTPASSLHSLSAQAPPTRFISLSLCGVSFSLRHSLLISQLRHAAVNPFAAAAHCAPFAVAFVSCCVLFVPMRNSAEKPLGNGGGKASGAESARGIQVTRKLGPKWKVEPSENFKWFFTLCTHTFWSYSTANITSSKGTL
jgi:hypothetical protein